MYGFWNVSKYWFNKLYKCQETTKFQKKKKKLINSRNSTKYYKPIYLPIYQQKIILSTMTGVRTWINSINKYNPCNEWGSNLRSQNCMLVDSVLDHLTTESLAHGQAKNSHSCSESINSIQPSEFCNYTCFMNSMKIVIPFLFILW